MVAMKWCIVVSAVLGIVSTVLADNRAEVSRARRHGAEAKVVVTVVHEDGSAVAGAEVTGTFPEVDTRNPKRFQKIEAQTDVNGQVTFQALCGGDAFIFVKKAGYYPSREVVRFELRNPSCVKEGRWQPWGYPCRIILKPKMFPRKLVSSAALNRATILFPKGLEERVGFDLERCDWVAPHGKGVVTDLLISCRWRTEGLPEGIERRREVVFEFPHEKDGAYSAPISTQSYLQTPHKADSNATYKKRFLFWRDVSFSPVAKAENLNVECLILRTRTVCDMSGTIISAHYTKVVAPPVIYQHQENEVRLSYFYNPTPNDSWLESDYDARTSGRVLRGAKLW